MSSRFQTTILSAVVAGVAFTGLFAYDAVAQQSTAAAPTKVGLIDMAEVFRDYEKFSALREDLKNEMVRMDAAAKPKIEELKSLQQQLQSGQLAQGSPERDAVETKLIGISTQLEALRKKAQVDVMRKESEIYKDIYLEVQDTVAKFAEFKQYDMIIRFNSSDLGEAANPQAVLQQMNRQVVFHKPSDNITAPVVQYLNKTYAKTAAK